MEEIFEIVAEEEMAAFSQGSRTEEINAEAVYSRKNRSSNVRLIYVRLQSLNHLGRGGIFYCNCG